MASITCFSMPNFGGASNTYTADNPDITASGAVQSCKVANGTVTVFQQVNYQGASAQLAAGDYPDDAEFPNGIASLKV